VHLLFWHGARPSEASGLWWKHIDHIRQSYHMGRYGKPKTKAARRIIELHPDTVAMLAAIRPLREAPEHPVFVNTEGNPIEPKAFSERWYECLRALGLRQRGLLRHECTFVTLTLATAREDVMLWVVKQTGVAYETLPSTTRAGSRSGTAACGRRSIRASAGTAVTPSRGPHDASWSGSNRANCASLWGAQNRRHHHEFPK
jgi:hypothetical protein